MWGQSRDLRKGLQQRHAQQQLKLELKLMRLCKACPGNSRGHLVCLLVHFRWLM